mmetsp:Transcript_41356/g.41980  ORF Transcript_41356/g.41980 Transcript_41356/m.41980 type:complete len:215 (+) Transcript_41356:115-759(+)
MIYCYVCKLLRIFPFVPLALIDQPPDRLLGSPLHNPMTQIQQMLPGPPGVIDTLPHRRFNLLFGPEQDRRIDIATDRNFRTEYFTGFGQVDAPIHRNHITPHIPLQFKIRTPTIGEINDRDGGVLLLHNGNGALGGGFGIPFELLGCQLMRPAFEHLDDLGAAFDLVASVQSDHFSEFVEEDRERFIIATFVRHEEFLGLQAGFGGFSFNGVRR